MSRKITQKEFIDRVKDNYIVIGEYKNSLYPVEVKCIDCGAVSDKRPIDIISLYTVWW